jgi:hypothetical protein
MDVYFDLEHPAGYAGIQQLQKATGYPKRKVKKFLDNQPVYRKFRVPKRKFKRAQIKATSLGVWFMADLFDMQKSANLNSGYKWILLVVDSFSRLIVCRGLKNKSGSETASGLSEIFSELTNKKLLAPQVLLATDLGTEFYNKECDKVYKEFNISRYCLRAPIKCSLAEISGRYLLDRLFKHMEQNKTKRWIDYLEAAVEGKNKKKNRKTANLAPCEINFDNQDDVYNSLYGNKVIEPFTLLIGDKVLVSKDRLPFAKARHGYYIEKVYRVIAIHKHNVPRYSLAEDDSGEPIQGTWYAEELYLLPRKSIT